MKEGEVPSAVVPRALRSCRGRGRRRSSHFTLPKQLKAQRRRREKMALNQIVEVDSSSNDTNHLNFKELGDICKVNILNGLWVVC
jgi:hypothetical protein